MLESVSKSLTVNDFLLEVELLAKSFFEMRHKLGEVNAFILEIVWDLVGYFGELSDHEEVKLCLNPQSRVL